MMDDDDVWLDLDIPFHNRLSRDNHDRIRMMVSNVMTIVTTPTIQNIQKEKGITLRNSSFGETGPVINDGNDGDDGNDDFLAGVMNMEESVLYFCGN